MVSAMNEITKECKSISITTSAAAAANPSALLLVLLSK